MRDKDANTAWSAASDGTLEERRYYCQNWRADVVALLKSSGDVSEWVRYSAYGEATVYPFVKGDFNGDGGVDGDDSIAFLAALDVSGNAADVNRSGEVDGDDTAAFFASHDNGYASTAWTATGGVSTYAGQLSITSGNRIGYAGYQFDPATEQYHVRHRVYVPEMGRWTRRDPLGYVDGMGLYEYVGGMPSQKTDPQGLAPPRSGGCSARNLSCGGGLVEPPTDSVLPLPWDCAPGFQYDWVRNQCVRWDFGPHFPYIPGLPDSFISCTENSVVASLISQISARCTGNWTFNYETDCSKCIKSTGEADCQTRVVKICSHECSIDFDPRNPSYFTTCSTLANELTHVLDFCTSGQCNSRGGFETATQACSEMRSTYYDCCTRRPRGGIYNDDVETYYDLKIGPYRRQFSPEGGRTWKDLEKSCKPTSCTPGILPQV